jgi:thioredoxin-related protein
MINFYTLSHILLWIFIILQTLIIAFLTKLIVRFLNQFRLEGNKFIAKGKVAPLFRDIDINGNQVRLSDSEDKFTLLVFIKDSCSICKKILPKISVLNSSSMIPLRTILIAPEEVDVEKVYYQDFDNKQIFIRSNDILKIYNIEEVPNLILIDSKGFIVDIYQYENLSELFLKLGINDKKLVS